MQSPQQPPTHKLGADCNLQTSAQPAYWFSLSSRSGRVRERRSVLIFHLPSRLLDVGCCWMFSARPLDPPLRPLCRIPFRDTLSPMPRNRGQAQVDRSPSLIRLQWRPNHSPRRSTRVPQPSPRRVTLPCARGSPPSKPWRSSGATPGLRGRKRVCPRPGNLPADRSQFPQGASRARQRLRAHRLVRPRHQTRDQAHPPRRSR